MAAREWWDAVKREVRDMLVPGQAKRMAAAASNGSPRLDAARRQVDQSLPPTLLPSEVIPTITAIDETKLALAPTSTTTQSSTSQIVLQTPSTSTAKPTPTAAASESGSGEMGVAAKAGIVIGALGGILALFVLVWLVFSMRRKKLAQRRQQMEDDEKINGPFADSAAIAGTRPTPNKAPRLSLRPVTQFLPNFTTQSHAERRSSRGIALALNPVSQPQLNRPTGGSAWERPTLRTNMASQNSDYNRPDTSASLHPNNPFHDNHRLPDEPVSPISSMGSFDHRVGMATTTADSIAEPVSPIFGDDDDDDRHNNRLGVASSSLTRKTSIRKDLPKPLDLTKPPSPLYAVPPSPAGTEYSIHSMAPGQYPGPSASAEEIAAAGGPSQSTVHRVQLDFKPTLQDEMGLRAGQLVRLLHEYDDGWALCIRLDRSQQGVVPRTCLSTRPVKPRPQPGAGNQRGGPPVNPSFHHHRGGSGSRNGRATSPAANFPPVPLAKDERYGGGSGGGAKYGYGRPRSPGGFGDGDGSPAPGQAY